MIEHMFYLPNDSVQLIGIVRMCKLLDVSTTLKVGKTFDFRFDNELETMISYYNFYRSVLPTIELYKLYHTLNEPIVTAAVYENLLF